MPEHNAVQSRRSFVDLLLKASVVGWLAAVLYPVLRYLKPLPMASGSGPVHLTRDEALKLERNQFVILTSGSRRLMVLQDPQQKLRAFDAKCTHEGCTVQYVPGESVIWCACHNGRFDLEGRVISGPPPRPLPQHTAKRDEDGSVSVVLERV